MKVTINQQDIDIDIEELAYKLANSPQSYITEFFYCFHNHIEERCDRSGWTSTYYYQGVGDNLKDRLKVEQLNALKELFSIEEK